MAAADGRHDPALPAVAGKQRPLSGTADAATTETFPLSTGEHSDTLH